MATWYGGVAANNGPDDASATLRLKRGTYTVFDFAQLGPDIGAVDERTLRVTDNGVHGARPRADARIDMDDVHGNEHGHVFESPDVLPASGTVLVRNRNEVIHFVDIQPVKPGTTDAQVQAAFDAFLSGQPPAPENDPFLEGDYVGMNVLSAGREGYLTYDLPPGTYVLVCFVGDELNGVPHAALGMHKVVTLR